MRTIYKYALEITDQQTVTMPKGASAVFVGEDPSGKTCLWAEVETENEPEDTVFIIRGTGHPIPDDNEATYIGTFLQSPFVWHIYRKIKA